MVVLDTSVLIWWTLAPHELSEKARKLLGKVSTENQAVVSSISIWEIALKVSRKKLSLGMEVEYFAEQLEFSGLVEIVPINHKLWISSVALDWKHKDPADRVIVALSKERGAKLVTSDKVISDFFEPVVW